ncbi:MAG TPA: DUF4388 domain-containing protein [Gemmatimonadales bacterium]|jgi:tetratricopeptide (TPR) repeat protein
MAVRGNLAEVSLPDVLQLLALGRKTGSLTVTDRANVGYIYLDDGRISFASIVNRRDRLGDLLVKRGRITLEQLEQAVERQGRERDRRLGDILVEDGVIDREELHRYVRVQIEEAVYFLFTWARGTFRFDSDARPEEQDFLVSINPESLLLEGARRVDEWSIIAKRIPSFDIIFEVDTERIAHAGVQLSAVQDRVLPYLDGTHDVTAIADQTGLSEFETGKALFGLLSAGFLKRVGRSRPGPSGSHIAPVEEHRNLGVAFYRTDMLEESLREFRQLVELRPTDAEALYYLGLIALRQARWDEAVARLRAAMDCGGGRPVVRYHYALALESGGYLTEADAAYREALAHAPHDWRFLQGWGIVTLLRGDHDSAAQRLDRAREVAADEPLGALWYWARALCATAAGDLEAAERYLRLGLAAVPENPALRNNLAVVLESQNRLAEAESLLVHAIAEDPWLPHLSKNLGDVHYRNAKYDEAWDAYQRVIRLRPEFGDDVYFRLGNIAYRRMDRESAVALWRQALALNPGHELARTNLDTLEALT